MEKISKIVIVGGGSAGWMTAASLVKNFPNIDITLVESSDIPTIGVGESTLVDINVYLEDLGLEDKDWMKFCNATYKTSIDFTNWDGQGTRVRYPFGYPNYLGSRFSSVDWFIRKALIGDQKNTYHWFALGTGSMIEHNKLTKSEDRINNWNFKRDTAYHLDSGLFGEYLKKRYCIPKGVIHIIDKVVSCPVDSSGNISKVETESNGSLNADLFIDCSGFYSLLLDKTMEEPFISFKDVLINDKAVAMRIPYVNKEKEMEHTTNATTLSSGWVWNTPLWDRIGTGYVYSSKFLSKEEAEKEFKEYLINSRDVPHSREEIESIGVLHVDINTGIHERAWVKNVCAIGLSNGFIEPLESTGLMLTHNTIFALVQALQSRDTRVNGWDKTIFNKKVRTHMQKFSGFIAAHFAFCERDDTAYWKYVTDTIDYGALESKEWYALQLVSDNLTIDRNWDTFDNISGVPFIMAGMGFNPLTEDIIRKSYGIGAGKLKGTVPWDNSIELTTYVNDYYDGIEEYIHSLDSHYKFLNSTIYKEIQ